MESFPTVADQVTAMGSVTPVRSSAKRATSTAIESRGLERARPIETVREVEAPTVREQILPALRSDTLNRAVNLAISVIGLIVLSPLLVLIAAIVKLTSRGPIFYTQTRVGIDRDAETSPCWLEEYGVRTPPRRGRSRISRPCDVETRRTRGSGWSGDAMSARGGGRGILELRRSAVHTNVWRPTRSLNHACALIRAN